jgi:predicted lipoprotein with Yx(FWY)xxD motif
MRSILKCLLPSLAIALTVAACGSSSKSSSSSEAASAPKTSATTSSAVLVKTAPNAKLGATVLTNSSGMTLYALSGESGAKFICTGSCEGIWHPLTASGAGAPRGSVASLTTVTRPDGSVQVAYKGMPLYVFAQDRKAGEANGEGIKDVGTWHAVTTTATTSSAPATQAAPPAESESSSSGSGGGGGYAY